jgi:AcrR family transcriptional regulator
MSRRADLVEETRRRIVEATVTLHQQQGLAATTIAAIGEEAGVTRLTVYRHFPEMEDLFLACSAHWRAGQRLPDPDAWRAVPDPAERLRVGLTDLYRHYREGEAMLRHVRAELDVLPQALRHAIEEGEKAWRVALVDGFPALERGPRLKAAIGHAVSFWTWCSLCDDEGLSNADAVELVSALVLAARIRRPRR